MSSRNKKVKVFDGKITIPAGNNSIMYHKHQVSHTGKSNHRIYGSLSVVQIAGLDNLDIKFHIMTDEQLANWVLPFAGYKPMGMEVREISDSKDHLYSTLGRQKKTDFDLTITSDMHLFFVFNNLFSQRTPKTIEVVIWEEWEEVSDSLDLVTTVPPQDRSLSNDVAKMISSAKHSLKIMTPYIDMLLVSEILEKHQKGLNITIITRSRKEFSGKDTKTAFDHIQESLKQNHRGNDLIHSRILICDDVIALVSSADLTQDSLIGQFNAGIILSDTIIINKLNDYFNQVWQKSSKI